MEGWIMLHRKIRSHWIWEDPVKLRWWIDMILEANHTDGTVNIGMQLIECKRGQSVRSLQGWSKRWGVSKSTVRSFFDLLKNDSMLCTENLAVTTRITILNYDDYQTLPHAKQTQRKRKPNATQTQADPNNNDNNDNNDNNIGTSEKSEKEKEFDRFNEWIDKNIPYLRKIRDQVTFDEYKRLTEKYNGEQIRKILTDIANYKKAPTQYTSVNLTFQKWAKKEYG
jgi:hypothetical protein